MVVVAEGNLSLAQDALRSTLADCTSFRGLTDPAMNQSQALARIYHFGLPHPSGGAPCYTRDQMDALRPYAVIYTDPHQGYRSEIVSGGAQFGFRDQGRLMLRIERECPDAYTDEPSSDANLDFLNRIGKILGELKDLSGTASYLTITAVELGIGPYWPDPDSVEAEGLFQAVVLVVEWEGLG